MGTFEKIVVLFILLICSVVLGISLHGGGPETGLPSGPLQERDANLPEADAVPVDDLGAGELLEEGPRVEGRADPDAATVDDFRVTDPLRGARLAAGPRPDDGTRGAPLLNSVVRVAGDAARPPILVSMAGLTPSASDEFYVYTVAAGDTWAGLGERFYGTAEKAVVLRRANEELRELAPGTEMLVPVYDARPEVDAPSEPRPARGGAQPAAPRTHVVQAGDSLSSIAAEHYGTASRYAEIFEANRDQLVDPDSLQIGMRLRIP